MVERFEDIYEFNIAGNYDVELERLQSSIDKARREWLDFGLAVRNSGAALRKPVKLIRELASEGEKGAISTAKQRDKMVGLASSSKVLAKAYNQLVREQNRLNIARQSELLALDKARSGSTPRVIEARAEVAALKRLSKGLQELAEKRFFAKKAAEAGLQVSADGKRLFDAEAEAAERAVAAQQDLARSRAFAKAGLDARGNLPLATPDGQLTEAGQLEVQRRAATSLQNLALKEQELALRINNKEWIETEKRVRAAEKQFNQLIRVGEKTEGTFNRVSFTFRRLIGIMAAFTIARQVVGGFNSMIATAIRFNAEIETSRVGLAGLIAASADIRSPTGDRLGIDDQVLRSQDLAIDQMAKLRKQALQTAASYDELAQAFQTAVAPGISAGLGLDQIRDITVLISQAATGLGVAQNQLAEEIRSLFQGTITPRNTRIATALGISNEDIKRARELGNLFEFLSSRFAAIGKTGKLLLNTFTGQLSNASDALKQLLAVSSAPLFEQLKAGLRDVQTAIFDTSKSADKLFNEEAIGAFRGLFEGLANGVLGIRAALQGLDATAFGDAFAAIGQSLGAIVAALAKAGVFLINAATPAVTLFGGLLSILTKASIVFKSFTGPVGELVGQIALTTARALILLKAFTLLGSTVGKLPALISKITAALVGSEVATKTATIATIGWRAALNAAWVAARRFLIPLLLAVTAVSAIDKLLESVGIKFSIVGLIGSAFESINGVLDSMLGSLSGVEEELKNVNDTRQAQVLNDFRQLKSAIEESRIELTRLRESASRQNIISDILRGRTDSAAARQAANIQEEINKVFDSDTVREYRVAVKGIGPEVEDLQKKLDGLNAEGTKRFQTEATKISNRLIETGKQLEINQKTLTEIDSSADITFIQRAAVRRKYEAERVRLLEEQENLTARMRLISGQQASLDEERLSVQGQIASLLESEAELEAKIADSVFEAKLLAQEKNKSIAKDEIASSETRVTAAQAELKALQETNIAFAEQDRLRTETTQRFLELSQLRAEQNIKELVNARDVKDLEDQIIFARQVGGAQNVEAAAVFEEQLRLKRRDLEIEKEMNAARVRRLELELRLAQLRESGSADQGIGFGLRGFAEDNASLFNTGEQFGRQLGEAIPRFASDGLRSTIAAAFDKTQNIDLSEALADIGAGIAIDLAANLASNLVSNALSGLIQSLGIGIVDTTGPVVAATTAAGIQETAATAAATATTAAASTAAGTWTSSAASWGAQILAYAGQAATTLSTASAASSVGGVASATGGSVNKAKRYQFPNLNLTHRNAPGFARGGRPAGIDPRDTVPAFLRPGEWVIRPEAVRLYGDRLFDLLNRGKLSPSALRGVAGASRAPSKAPKIKAGFATGGAVVGAPRQAPSTAPSVSQVIQFHDEQTMERALAAGPNASIRFARSRRGAYRAALGIDPGT